MGLKVFLESETGLSLNQILIQNIVLNVFHQVIEILFFLALMMEEILFIQKMASTNQSRVLKMKKVPLLDYFILEIINSKSNLVFNN